MSGIKLDPRNKLQTLTALKDMVVKIEAMPVQESCSSCMHYCPPTTTPNGVTHTLGGPQVNPMLPRGHYCNKWKNEIPANVLPDGCGSGWEFDDIPF